MASKWHQHPLSLTAGACGLAGVTWLVCRELKQRPDVIQKCSSTSDVIRRYSVTLLKTISSSDRVSDLARTETAHYLNSDPSFQVPNLDKVEPMMVRKAQTCDYMNQRRRIVVALVGLPARGKSFLSLRIQAFFTWQGARTKIFNVGQRRRQVEAADQDSSYFDPNNSAAKESREAIAMSVVREMLEWMDKKGALPAVAIFDATNSTAERRRRVQKAVKDHSPAYDVVFLESLCDDPEILDANIRMKCIKSPDYKHMTYDEAKKDFEARVEKYKSAYEPLDNDGKIESDLSYIKMINMSAHLVAHNVYGRRALSLLPFLMALHIGSRPVWLVRMPRPEGDFRFSFRQWLFPESYARNFGDQSMSKEGLKYAAKLANYLQQDATFQTARIFTCSHRRAMQTASLIDCTGERTAVRAHLNPMEWGRYNGIPRKDFERKTSAEFFKDFCHDPMRTRFPGGESYEDFARRLNPVLVEVEQQVEPVIIIAPISTLQVLHCYFDGNLVSSASEIKIEPHTVVEWRPVGGLFKKRVITEAELC
mmetsp:Transcript_7924/g.14551  ORF Transcript_7924/g.14551 Transcript_7924/m.14551 type:complete len:536 (+) Transcript_7924:42-1649(+)